MKKSDAKKPKKKRVYRRKEQIVVGPQWDVEKVYPNYLLLPKGFPFETAKKLLEAK